VDRRLRLPGEVGPQAFCERPFAFRRQPRIVSPAGHAIEGLDGLEAQLRPVAAEGLQEHFLDVDEVVEAPQVQQLPQEGQALLQAQLEEVALFEHLEQLGLQTEGLPLQVAEDGLGLGGVLPGHSEMRGQGANQPVPVGDGAEDVLEGAPQLGPGGSLGQDGAGGHGEDLARQRLHAQGQSRGMFGKAAQPGEEVQLGLRAEPHQHLTQGAELVGGRHALAETEFPSQGTEAAQVRGAESGQGPGATVFEEASGGTAVPSEGAAAGRACGRTE